LAPMKSDLSNSTIAFEACVKDRWTVVWRPSTTAGRSNGWIMREASGTVDRATESESADAGSKHPAGPGRGSRSLLSGKDAIPELVDDGDDIFSLAVMNEVRGDAASEQFLP
jgi:hypothetical protein